MFFISDFTLKEAMYSHSLDEFEYKMTLHQILILVLKPVSGENTFFLFCHTDYDSSIKKDQL